MHNTTHGEGRLMPAAFLQGRLTDLYLNTRSPAGQALVIAKTALM